MAKALRCPMCGHPHPLQNYANISTFPCENCGQPLKVPGAAASTSASSQDTNANTRLVWRPPTDEVPEKKPVSTEAVAAASMSHAAASASRSNATAVLPRTRVDADPKSADEIAKRRPKTAPRNASADPRLPVAWQVITWIIGVVSSLILVLAPLKVLGLFSKTRVADIVLGAKVTRFVPLVLFILLWAIAATIVVQILTMLLLRLNQRRLMTAR